MKNRSISSTVVNRIKQRPVLFIILCLAVIGVGVFILKASRPPVQTYSFFEVKRGDFLVSVVEGGTLQAVQEVAIRNEVEGTARIIFIVPEGSYAKKGQLLVELDSSSSQDAVNQQQINTEKAQFALVQAQQQLEIQKSVVDSEIQAADLKVEFAQTDLDKFKKGEVEQTRRNAQIEITNVLDSLQIAEERLQWSEELFKKGYESKGNLDNDRLKVTQTALRLEQAQTNLWMIETFDIPKKRRSLESALQEAKENRDRVKLQGERRIAQFEADLETQQRTVELSQTKLARDKKQLLATKIFAPQDGLVVYGSAEGGGRFSNESMIEEGAVVRFRQELIKLPDVSAMKIRVKIHESHINQVRVDQPAYVVLDSMPDQRFIGRVNKVAPLPDSQSRWGNPDLKVYATEILITDKLPDVKPGVSAKAEIVITNLSGVLSVPIQSITSYKGKPTVYLVDANPKPVQVTVGMYNTKFIEITSGLNPKDRVLLSPPLDTKDKDLAGAIIVEGEVVPVANTTNAAPRARIPDPGSQNGVPGGQPGERSFGNPGDLGGDPMSGSRTNRRSFGEGMPGAPGMNDPQDPAARNPARTNRGGGPRMSQEEMLKQFDTNGDGTLDETERAAIRERFGRGNRPGGSTNNPPAQTPQRPDVNP